VYDLKSNVPAASCDGRTVSGLEGAPTPLTVYLTAVPLAQLVGGATWSRRMGMHVGQSSPVTGLWVTGARG